jgi:hypothetical protein
MKEPKYKLGDIVIVNHPGDKQKIAQGKVVSVECFFDNEKQGTWFYSIEIPSSIVGGGNPFAVYTYEKDTGDAKTKIIISQ